MIDTVVSSGTDFDVLISAFQQIFHHLIAATLVIQTDIDQMAVFGCVSVGIDRHDRFFDQLINLFTVVSAEGDGDHAVHIPACHHLKNLFDVFCGIQHQVIALFLHIFFDKSDDLPVKWISENGIFEFFMIVNDNCDQLRLLVIQHSQSSFLHVTNFFDQCFDLLDRCR